MLNSLSTKQNIFTSYQSVDMQNVYIVSLNGMPYPVERVNEKQKYILMIILKKGY